MNQPETLTRRGFVQLAGGAIAAGRGAARGAAPSNKMRVIGFPRGLSDSSLQFIKQIGCDDVRISASDIAGYSQRGHLDSESALALRRRLESFGLRWGTLYLAK